MKHLKLFESFEDIDSICKKYKIRNYTINNDGTVDVNGDVSLTGDGLSKLPLKFGKVTGNFDCSRNQLISLEGAPKEVYGDFYCYNNQLKTLKGSPSYIGRDFVCTGNQLTTLEGAPSHVGDLFDCSNNKLVTLEGAPIEVGFNADMESETEYFDCENNPIYQIYILFPNRKSFMNSLDYNYLRGTDIVKMRFREACEEAGIKMPKKIQGYNYI